MADHPLLDITGGVYIPQITDAIVAAIEDTTSGTPGLDLRTYSRWALDIATFSYQSAGTSGNNVIIADTFEDEETTLERYPHIAKIMYWVHLPDISRLEDTRCHEHRATYQIMCGVQRGICDAGGTEKTIAQWLHEYTIRALDNISTIKRYFNDTDSNFREVGEIQTFRLAYAADRRMKRSTQS